MNKLKKLTTPEWALVLFRYQNWAPSHHYMESFASPHQQSVPELGTLTPLHESLHSSNTKPQATRFLQQQDSHLPLDGNNQPNHGKLDNAVQYPQALPKGQYAHLHISGLRFRKMPFSHKILLF